MTYNADNQLLTWQASAAAAAQSVMHDDDGNTTTGPLPDLNSPATGVSSTYSYDAENLRTSSTENGVTSQWTINPHGLSGLSEALVRVKGGVTTRYVYGLGLLYEEEEVATPVVRTYHFDRQGSTAAITATDGLTVTDRFEYAAYGERTHRTGSTDTPFQFNGFFGVQTDASGLLYMRARYYNVETRRFQSADPMGFAESSNFYWFANADPVSLVDPFGLGASDGGGFWSGVGRVLGNAAREVFEGASQVVRKAWNTPNTAVGLVWGTIGLLAEVAQLPFTGRWDYRLTFGNNALQIENHPFMSGAITLGNTISYANDFGPDYWLSWESHVVGDHERQHTYQGELLGVFYLPSNLVGLSLGQLSGDHHGSINWNETGPQMNPPRPWP